MKNKKVKAGLLTLLLITGLTACGGNQTTDSSKDNTSVAEKDTGKNQDDSGSKKTDEENKTDDSGKTDDNTKEDENKEDENASKLAEYKTAALAKLDEIVNPVINKIKDDGLKASVKNYYDTEKQYINGITDLNTAKDAAAKVVSDTKTFANNTLKPLAIEKINGVINPLIGKISHQELKTSVQTFYNTEISKINDAENLSDIPDLYEEVIEDTKAFIVTETDKIIVALKNEALEALNPYVTALIEKIPYDSVRSDTRTFYNKEKEKLEAVDTIEGVTPVLNEIKEDLEEYALSETKKYALEKLDEIVKAGIAKIPNEELKENLNDFSDDEIAKLNAVTKIEDVPTVLATVTSETETYIKNLLVSTVKDYLARLTAVETTTAYDYLPEAMCPSYEGNIVKESDIDYDFGSFTNVTDINKAGYGEQWQMVVENINQSITMAKVLNVAQTALNAAGNLIDIYITNSYAESIYYEFESDDFDGLFRFYNLTLDFNISLKKDIEIPLLGSFKPEIRMIYNILEDRKVVSISLDDAYKVRYVISDDSYEMASIYGITIAGKTGSRSSCLSISKNNGKTFGRIYEFTSIEGLDEIKAGADFYVENGFVSVVGNKSSGMKLFDGYINELYSASEGRLLGYEVREEKTIVGVTATYNTLWFNLWDIQGINSVKVTDKTDKNESSRSTVDAYLNGSSNLLVPTYNKKVIKTSRKYDIEPRARYYYTYDTVNETYVSHEIQVPMMFIQEGDNFNSFVNDMLEDNGINVSVVLSQNYLNKILDDYDTLIDVFISNKEEMSSEYIISCFEK